MKKWGILILVVVLMGACRYRTGSGNIISDNRNLAAFKGVKASSGFEVEIKTGMPQTVMVEADDNLMKYIITEVDNGMLRIGIRDNTSLHDAHLKVFVTAPEINKVLASSAAEITVKNWLRSTGKISLDASSGGKIVTDLDAPEVDAEASSGSTLKLKGQTMNLKAKASSGGSIKAPGLLSENATANSSSGSSINLHASVSLKASASSGATIRYRGAANVSKEESSGGSVEKE